MKPTPKLDPEEKQRLFQAALCVPLTERVPLPPFGASRAITTFLFDAVLPLFYSKVTIEQHSVGEEVCYRFFCTVPFRTVEFVVTPMLAALTASMLNKLQDTRKTVVFTCKDSNVVYIPRWARAIVFERLKAIVQHHSATINALIALTDPAPPTLH